MRTETRKRRGSWALPPGTDHWVRACVLSTKNTQTRWGKRFDSSFLGFFRGQAEIKKAGPHTPHMQTLLEEWKYLLRVDVDCSDQGAVISVFIFHTTAPRRVEPRRAGRGVRPASSLGKGMEAYFQPGDHCNAWAFPRVGLCYRLRGNRCPKPYREGEGSAPFFSDRGNSTAAR